MCSGSRRARQAWGSASATSADSAPAVLNATNIGIGGLATVLGAWNLFRTPDERVDVPVPASSAGLEVSLSPLIGVERTGVLLQMRF